MEDAELLRYARHILLDDIGVEGQQRLRDSHVVIVGAGGLGSPAAMYLAAAGVGQMTLVDPDVVDVTNLQRQILHATDSVGTPKVVSAARTLRALNPWPTLHTHCCAADEQWLTQHLHGVDVVLDCSDNFVTRHNVNKACVASKTPLVSGAAIRFDGQVAVFDSRHQQSPCYACAFPADDAPPETQCATMGVFAPLVGIIGSIQAAEALKLLLGFPMASLGNMLLLDGIAMEWTTMRVVRDAACRVCGAHTA
ncbi:MAG: HesA/MoeB/ThiF family protein [Rhodoferax sp.]|nr:HesA/MoeB/ThiF family protein [Rhodoferax sp.]